MRKTSLSKGNAIGKAKVVDGVPASAEYAYYAVLYYGIFASPIGFNVPLLGAGGLTLLAMFCVVNCRRPIFPTYAPIACPIACAISFVFIQMVIHNQSFMAADIRGVYGWVIGLIIIQSLLLREGFLHRFTIVALVIGFLMLPYLVSNYGDVENPSVSRVGLERAVGFANPNDFAAWVGFCCVNFFIIGIETKRNVIRTVSLLIASLCLFIVGLTVSRGTLLAIVISAIIALRRSLKRGFLPLLLSVVILFGLFYLGVFEELITSYAARGTEETGRLLVWPLIIERVLESPFVGVGINNIGTYVPFYGFEISPHNVFLYVALASGIVPFILFVLYWLNSVKGAYDLNRRKLQDAAFQLPLIAYAFIICSLSGNAFMFPWVMLTLCNSILRPTSQTIASRPPRSYLLNLSLGQRGAFHPLIKRRY